MARTKKPEPITTYRHEKSRIEVPIFLDRNTFKYFGEYQGRRHENKDHEALVKAIAAEIEAEIEADSGLTWEPVIHISVQTRAKEPYLSFTYERFLICHRNSRGGDKLKGGDLLKCPWHVEINHQRSDEDLAAFEKKNGREPMGWNERYYTVVHEGLEIPDNLRLAKSGEWHWNVDRAGPFKVPCRPHDWRGVEDEIYVAYDERLWTTLTILHARLDALAGIVRTDVDALAGASVSACPLSTSLGAGSVPGVPIRRTFQSAATNERDTPRSRDSRGLDTQLHHVRLSDVIVRRK